MAKVRFGLSNVHTSIRTESEGTVSYATPVAFPGAVSLSLTRSSDRNDFNADNIVYYTSFNRTEREGELEMALITDYIKENFLGYLKDTAGHLVETNQTGKSFALLFQVETDDSNKKYCIYNCQASESDSDYETIEGSPEPQTQTINLSMAGETVNGVQVYIAEVSDFSAVALPELANV